MKIVVAKFGGAALSTPEQFGAVAELIIELTTKYDKVVVVVSAMGNTTDQLLDLAKQIHPNPPKREQDMMISVGERISMALLAMALSLKDVHAISLTGSQSGVITTKDHADAKIIEVRPARILKHLAEDKIVIVAGFQGVSVCGEITTLGRGGSDTSAVSIAAALGAEHVEFFKDVDGVYSGDPKSEKGLQKFSCLSYEQMLLILQKGGRILHSRAVCLAQKNGIPLYVRSFSAKNSGTWILGNQSRSKASYEII